MWTSTPFFRPALEDTMKTTATIAGLMIASAAHAQDLTVYTYDSFVPDWGPGPGIEAGFEAACGCDIELVAAGDGAAVLSRLMLEGARTDADVVIGLDQNLIPRATDSGLFAAHGVDADLDLPLDWTDDTFLPFDFGWFAFVSNVGTEAPADFQALADSDLKIAIQDPRSSTPGLGLVMWVDAAYGQGAGAVWEALADNIVTVTPGWSDAYGLFLEGEVDAVLSYTTSPAYHAIAEEDDSKTAWEFSEGHGIQIEVAAMVAGTDAPELAQEFLAYLVSDEAQAILPTTNWMYPAVTPEGGLPEGFDALISPAKTLMLPPEKVAETREAAIETWRQALAQ